MSRMRTVCPIPRCGILAAVLCFCLPVPLMVAQTWTGATGNSNWSNPGNWSDGTVPTEIDDDVIVGSPAPAVIRQNLNLNTLFVEADGQVNVGDGNVSNLDFGGIADTTLTNEGIINIAHGSDLQLQSDVINRGNINVNAIGGGFVTKVEIDQLGATIDGGGTIALNGINPVIGSVLGTTGASFTILDQTIEGKGELGGGDLEIFNSTDGLVDANVANERIRILTVDDGFTNEGVLRASSGGRLEIGTEVLNTNVIEALDGSRVDMSFSRITGGTLRCFGTGFFTVVGFSTMEDLTFEGTFRITNGRTVAIVGSINNTGLIDVDSPDNLFGGVQHENATLTGGGTVRLIGDRASIVGSSRLLILGHQTIEGQGMLERGFGDIADSPESTIDANVPAKVLELNNGNSSGVFVSSGTIKASNGGRFVCIDRLSTFGSIHVEQESHVMARFLRFHEGSRISGAGRIATTDSVTKSFVDMQGAVAPGEVDSAGSLSLSHTNPFIMYPTASLEIDLTGPDTGDNLTIASGAGLFIDGELLVTLEDSYLPCDLDSFEIVTGKLNPYDNDPTLTGRFNNVSFPDNRVFTVGGEGSFEVEYDFDSITLSKFRPLKEALSTISKEGKLRVFGTGLDDNIDVSVIGPAEVRVTANGNEEVFSGVMAVEICGFIGADEISSNYDEVVVRAGLGDDTVTLSGKGTNEIHGGDGDDTLVGGTGPDSIYGGNGADDINGRGGSDYIDAGLQAVTAGDHIIQGGDGNDTIIGSSGADQIYGGNGADTIHGLSGSDILHGGLGRDSIFGGSGNDQINGGDAADTISGGDGFDTIVGGRGGDTLNGGLGDDLIFGGVGADNIVGGDGHDDLFGGPQADYVLGGNGDDFISGGVGPDDLFGNVGNDTLFGDGSDDFLNGGLDDDTLVGGGGLDELHGGPGFDTAQDTGELGESGIEN